MKSRGEKQKIYFLWPCCPDMITFKCIAIANIKIGQTKAENDKINEEIDKKNFL